MLLFLGFLYLAVMLFLVWQYAMKSLRDRFLTFYVSKRYNFVDVLLMFHIAVLIVVIVLTSILKI